MKTREQCLRVAWVSYVSDLVNARQRQVIKLGVLVEFRTDEFYGLALKARPELSDAEAAMIGAPMRAKLREPQKFLEELLEQTSDSADGKLFSDLPKRHRGSLRIEIVRDDKKHLPVLVELQTEEQVANWVVDKLSRKLEASFHEFLTAPAARKATRAAAAAPKVKRKWSLTGMSPRLSGGEAKAKAPKLAAWKKRNGKHILKDKDREVIVSLRNRAA